MARRRTKPLQMYKGLIDELVNRRDGVLGAWITKRGWPKLPENAKMNALLAELTPGQKKLIAKIAQEARDGGIHDTLVVLHERQYFSKLRLVQSGVELPFEPFGTQMYYDWVCRVAGDTWPDERKEKGRVKPNSAVQPTRQKRRAAHRGR